MDAIVTLVKSVSGLDGFSSHDDWYSFTLTAKETIGLDLAAAYGSPSATLWASTDTVTNSVPGLAIAGQASDGWINESLAAGTYFIDIKSGDLSQYTLNLSIGSSAVASSGSSLGGSAISAAYQLGSFSSSGTGVGSTSTTDTIAANQTNWYSFTIGNIQQVGITLSGLNNSLSFDQVTLCDASGNAIRSASATSSGNGSLIVDLPPLSSGRYYIEVNGSATDSFNLQLTSTAIPERAGSSIGTATALGTLSSSATTVSDQVNNADLSDYYQFKIGANSEVAISLSGLDGNVGLTLYDSSGNSIAKTTSDGISRNAWMLEDLAGAASGTSYYIGVSDLAGYAVKSIAYTVPYVLALTAVADPSGTGLSQSTATSVSLATPTTVPLSFFPTETSLYDTFTLSASTTVNFLLSGYSNTSAEADALTLQLFGSAGAQIGSTITATTSNPQGFSSPANGQETFTLAAGTYTIKTVASGVTLPQTASLSITTGLPSVGTAAGPFAGGATLPLATNLGTLGASPVVKPDYVGGSRSNEYYSFTLSAASLVQATISNTSNAATLSILTTSGTQIGSASSGAVATSGGNFSSSGASLNEFLAAGTYAVNVAALSSATGYNLSLLATPIVTGGGSSIANPVSLGSIGTTAKVVSGTTDLAAQDAYYSFTLTTEATITALLTGLESNTTLQLYNPSGTLLYSDAPTILANNPYATFNDTLVAGNYVIDIKGSNQVGVGGPYTLSLSGVAVADVAGSSMSSADALGTLDPASSTGTGTTGTGSTGTGSTGTGGTGTGGTGTSSGPVTVSIGGAYTTTASTTNTINVPVSGTVNTVATSTNSITLGTGTGVVNSAGTDTITAGSGAASVTANGATYIIGGAGALTVNNGAGTCVTFGGTGGVTYTGGTGFDIVVGKGGPVNIHGGTGGGDYWGAGNSTVVAGSGAQAVLIGYAGDQLFSAGSAGDLFGANAGGNIVMSGVSSTGNDVFFGAAGTGTLTFITGSGNDILGLGQGTNTVTLGAGHSTVFANTGTSGVSTITAGTGSADIGLGGKSVNLIIGAANARNFALFNFVPGADKITLTGYSSTQAATALASQTVSNGITQLTLSDKSVISLIGVTHADSSLFG